MKKYILFWVLCGISILFFSICAGNSQAQWFPRPNTYSPSMLLPVYPIYYNSINYMLGGGTLPLLPPALLNAVRLSKIVGTPGMATPAPLTAIPYSSYYSPTTSPLPTLTTSYYLYNVNYLTSIYYYPPAITTPYGTWGFLNSAIAFPFP